MSFKRLLEVTGIDWMPYVFSRKSPSLPDPPEDRASLKGEFATLSAEALLETLTYSQGFFADTEDRVQRIEGKATSLMGFAGAGLALSATIAASLRDPRRALAPASQVGLWAVFVLVAGSFIVTLILLSKVLDVHRYKHVALTRGTAQDLIAMRVDRAVDLVYGQSCNDNIAREKATYLGGGQLWFRNAILALFTLSLGYLFPPNEGAVNRSLPIHSPAAAPVPTAGSAAVPPTNPSTATSAATLTAATNTVTAQPSAALTATVAPSPLSATTPLPGLRPPPTAQSTSSRAPRPTP